MTVRRIPDGHHVVRHVGGSKVEDGIINPDGFWGNVPLSVNWLECVEGDKREQLNRVRDLSRRKLGATSVYAELKVSEVRNLALGLEVRADPLPAEDSYSCVPCHAEIVGITEDPCRRKLVSEALADSVIETHPASRRKS